MAHEHRSGKGNCDCGCHEHSTRNTYVYMPSSVHYGPPCRITGAEINWMCVLVVWAIVAYALYGGGIGALESVLLAPFVMLALVAALIAVVGIVIWLVCTITKALRRLRKGIRLNENPHDYLYADKKQKPKTKWSETGFALFLTTAMDLCIPIDRFDF